MINVSATILNQHLSSAKTPKCYKKFKKPFKMGSKLSKHNRIIYNLFDVL